MSSTESTSNSRKRSRPESLNTNSVATSSTKVNKLCTSAKLVRASFICPACESIFTNKLSLQIHYLTEHGKNINEDDNTVRNEEIPIEIMDETPPEIHIDNLEDKLDGNPANISNTAPVLNEDTPMENSDNIRSSPTDCIENENNSNENSNEKEDDALKTDEDSKPDDDSTYTVEALQTTENRFVCPKCPAHYSSKVYIRVHLLQKHNIKDYDCRLIKEEQKQLFKCLLCSYKSYDDNRFINHSKSHTNRSKKSVTYFYCEVCEIKFTSRDAIADHNKQHDHITTERDEIFNPLPEKKKSTGNTRNSKYSHILPTAPNNTKRYVGIDDSALMSNQDTGPILLLNPNSTVARFGTGASYPLDNRNLPLYIEKKQGSPYVMNKTTSVSQSLMDKTLKCVRCNLYFPTNQKLSQHISNIHNSEINYGNKKDIRKSSVFQCGVCLKKFITPVAMSNHLKECGETYVVPAPETRNVKVRIINSHEELKSALKTIAFEDLEEDSD